MFDLSDSLRHKRPLTGPLIILGLGLLIGLLAAASSTASKALGGPPEPIGGQNSFWNVHLYAIPGVDGTTLNAAVENIGNSCQGDVEFIAEYQGTQTPALGVENPNQDRYVAVISDFFPGCTSPPCTATENGTLQVRCTQPQLSSRTVNFRRYYVSSGANVNILSQDNLAQLETFAGSITTDEYVIVMPANTAPGPPTSGDVFLGEPYSVRNSGLLPISNDNMNFVLRYSNAILGNANPLTLRIFEWNSGQKQWRKAGAQTIFTSIDPRVSKPTRSFTTYVLGSTPLWCDPFTDVNGLDGAALDNITSLDEKLQLEFTAQPGVAASNPYTPTLPMKAWRTVSYTATMTAGASLTVSILSRDGMPLLRDVSSGQSVAALDPAQHPSLRLQVEMATTGGASPTLNEWCLLAEPALYDVYLPLVIK